MSMSREAKKEVERFLREGKKIAAIKYLQDSYGFSLSQSKTLVEALEENGNDNPMGAAQGRALSSGAGGILLGAFIALGLLFLGGATYVYLRQSQSIQQSDLIKGKVVSMQHNNEGLSAPVIEYEWHGQKKVYSSNTYSSPPAFSVHEEVPVYVNRQDPETITVDTFSERWLLIFILSGLGVFFVGIPMLIMYFTTRR